MYVYVLKYIANIIFLMKKKDIYDKIGADYHTHVTTVNNNGVKIVSGQ